MKNEIKVIKKVDRERAQEPAPKDPKGVTKESTRDAIGTISGWVREIQGRRRIDPKRAFKNLFSESLVSET
jgi:hypothetical protein